MDNEMHLAVIAAAVMACLLLTCLTVAVVSALYLAWKRGLFADKTEKTHIPCDVAPEGALDKLDEPCKPVPDSEIPFDAEEALSEMNEWERSLCEKQRMAWEVINPGKMWKLTPYIFRQIKRATLRRF